MYVLKPITPYWFFLNVSGSSVVGKTRKGCVPETGRDSLYTPSSFPSSLLTATSPIPLSVSASARTNPAHLKELKLCKHLVEYLRLVPSETHPRYPTALPSGWKHQDFFFFFFQAFSRNGRKKKKRETTKQKGPFYVWRWDAIVSTSPSSSSKNIKRLAEALPTSWCRWPDSDGTF